ncbi:bleomycin resistance family protein [Cupriavidus sp. AU9028]|uniref:bleomycin resistance family protein n=1 Tax=Cupriavidus sp. AU9028 TaxID=2871157 RepID=UPI001C9785CF|nr:bleomycin resistance family protein [Cupriavidus sp. AU9028]MBY4898515.1 bleomycin resistance family protein [Cupriavidus sp. AU9028]
MSLSLLLYCTDLRQTEAWYAALGFDVRASQQNTITVERHGCKLLFTEQDLWNAPPALTGTIYCTIPDVEAFYESVKGRATMAWPLQRMRYGSIEFALIDCNGYLLAFQQQV